ncbi:MAG: elongation factor P--(R)-beta-lysine ligase [Patescibacteria group bacterium]|jgi:lysyl-tRNA synthetase class 2|nr:elongation factor P--(R)-beta-lysine ligase [Patescibacteria group bacterium]
MLSKQDLELRAKLWNDVQSSIHKFFVDRGYLNVQTPLAVRSPGMEPNLDPVGVDVKFIDGTTHRAGLITSPEYSMKKLLGAGLEKIYTITPVFRNVEKMGERWSVEFSMLEWYQQGKNYEDCMRETEELVNFVLDGALPATDHQPWPRVSYVSEFEKYFGYHPADATPEQAAKVADLFQFEVMPRLEAEHSRFFLTDYPVAEAALAQKNQDGRSAQRFEAYVNGLEICNGFTELVDPIEQRARFELEAAERRLAGKEVFPIDEELLNGLASVRSPSFGNALGVDRLVMLKAGVKNIDAIHLFPPSQRF